jgi:hypothetical protein
MRNPDNLLQEIITSLIRTYGVEAICAAVERTQVVDSPFGESHSGKSRRRPPARDVPPERQKSVKRVIETAKLLGVKAEPVMARLFRERSVIHIPTTRAGRLREFSRLLGSGTEEALLEMDRELNALSENPLLVLRRALQG